MKRHSTDVTSLVFGLLFLSVFGLWYAVEYGSLGAEGLAIAGPVALVMIGLVGLLASMTKLRDKR